MGWERNDRTEYIMIKHNGAKATCAINVVILGLNMDSAIGGNHQALCQKAAISGKLLKKLSSSHLDSAALVIKSNESCAMTQCKHSDSIDVT